MPISPRTELKIAFWCLIALNIRLADFAAELWRIILGLVELYCSDVIFPSSALIRSSPAKETNPATDRRGTFLEMIWLFSYLPTMQWGAIPKGTNWPRAENGPGIPTVVTVSQLIFSIQIKVGYTESDVSWARPCGSFSFAMDIITQGNPLAYSLFLKRMFITASYTVFFSASLACSDQTKRKLSSRLWLSCVDSKGCFACQR